MAWPDVIPFIRYEDPTRMIEWLGEAFGFVPHAVHSGEGGGVEHAEITFGSGMVMIGPTREGANQAKTPRQLGGELTGGFYVVVDDPDTHYQRARAAGAEITRELEEMDYGSREYSARDPEGHTWTFGTYRPE